MTSDQITAIVKRVCQGNRERYTGAQKRAAYDTKWPDIWSHAAEAVGFVESDLLAALGEQSETQSEIKAVSAADVLEIVNAVCDEEYGYYVNGSFDDFDSRQKCRTVTIRIKGKIARRCQERGLVLEKQVV